jgi:hypothetical protein
MLVPLQKIGDDDGNASAYASHAVDEDVGLFSCLFYEVESLVKVSIDGIFFMVFGGNVEIVGNVIFFMGD